MDKKQLIILRTIYLSVHREITTNQARKQLNSLGTSVCVSKLTIIGSDKWLVDWPSLEPVLEYC